MIRLLATDLDGTLFYPKDRFHAVGRKNREFLRFLRERGIDILYVSGRNPKILPVLERIDRRSYPLLGCNGAYLYQDGQVFDRQPMDRKGLERLVLALEKRKDIYALACIVGGSLYCICLTVGMGHITTQLVTAVSVILCRVIAVKYHISLPVLKGNEDTRVKSDE